MQSFDVTKLPTPEEVQKRVQEYASTVVLAQAEYAKTVYSAWTSFFKPAK